MQDPKSTKSPDFYATHVKTVVIAFHNPGKNLLTVLKACIGVGMLAIWPTFSDSEMFWVSNLGFLAPVRLAISGDALPSDNYTFTAPLFQRLTHLDIVWSFGEKWRWKELLGLRYLTHFSLDIRFYPANCLQSLGEITPCFPPSLVVFVVWLPSSTDGDENGITKENADAVSEGCVDMRLILASMDDLPLYLANHAEVIVRHYPDLLRDWSGRSIGGDFWTQAEEIVAKRYQRMRISR